MHHMEYTAFVLLFFRLYVQVTGQCKITAQNAEDETRLVIIQKNGLYEIFNEDKVTLDTTLYFVCDDDDVVAVKCNRNRRFNRTLPIQNCEKFPKAKVQLVQDNTCNAQMYSVAYEFRNQNLEVYRSCFDKEGISAQLTTHIGNPFGVATQRPAATFTRDGIITVKDAASYQAKSIFKRFKVLLGPNQNYITSERTIVIDRGHLVPSADFVFDSNMNATFKYINVIPQFSTINRGNWKSIENYVRKRIGETGTARIWTGAFDVLQLKDQNNNQVLIYLEDNNKNPIPKWIYKIFRNEKETFVFLTYNNIFDINRPSAPTVCHKIECPINLKDSPESGFTFCCDPNYFMRNVFPK